MAVTFSSKHGAARFFPILKIAGDAVVSRAPVALTKAVVLIGRHVGVHLPLASKEVSKLHALIIKEKDRVYIRDLASRNRLIVNDQPVREADLGTGDVVRVGPYRLHCASGFAEPDPAAGPAAPPAALEINGGNAHAPLLARAVLIGTREECDVVLADDDVAPVHAVLFELDGRRHLRDLGSAAGTFVNGARIHQQQLNLGDEIRVGHTRLRYVAADEVSPDQFGDADLADVTSGLGVLGDHDIDDFDHAAHADHAPGIIDLHHDDLDDADRIPLATDGETSGVADLEEIAIPDDESNSASDDAPTPGQSAESESDLSAAPHLPLHQGADVIDLEADENTFASRTGARPEDSSVAAIDHEIEARLDDPAAEPDEHHDNDPDLITLESDPDHPDEPVEPAPVLAAPPHPDDELSHEDLESDDGPPPASDDLSLAVAPFRDTLSPSPGTPGEGRGEGPSSSTADEPPASKQTTSTAFIPLLSLGGTDSAVGGLPLPTGHTGYGDFDPPAEDAAPSQPLSPEETILPDAADDPLLGEHSAFAEPPIGPHERAHPLFELVQQMDDHPGAAGNAAHIANPDQPTPRPPDEGPRSGRTRGARSPAVDDVDDADLADLLKLDGAGATPPAGGNGGRSGAGRAVVRKLDRLVNELSDRVADLKSTWKQVKETRPPTESNKKEKPTEP